MTSVRWQAIYIGSCAPICAFSIPLWWWATTSGLMIAYAYAQAYRSDVSHLVIMDAPLPGTAVFDRLRSDPRVWHFAFHGARDVAEMLVAGRERQYLQYFFNVR